MRNTGTQPDCELVDIRLVGVPHVFRERKASLYDWNLGDKCKGIPIRDWQPSKP